MTLSLLLAGLLAVDPNTSAMAAWLEDVESSPIRVFGARSGIGKASMNPLKIIQAGQNNYIGIQLQYLVHHALSLSIDRSSDLNSWRPAAPPEHEVMGASMHRIDSRWLVAVSFMGGDPMQLRGYSSLDALLKGKPEVVKKLPTEWAPVLGMDIVITSASARGPRWRDVDVSLAFSYLADEDELRLGSGTLTGFSKWISQSCVRENAQLTALYKGDIRPCDSFETNAGRFDLVTVKEKGDWDSPRVFLLRRNGGEWLRVLPKTAGGSPMFFDPKVSVIDMPDGTPGGVAAWRIPHKNAAPGEHGTLIYAKPLPT